MYYIQFVLYATYRRAVARGKDKKYPNSLGFQRYEIQIGADGDVGVVGALHSNSKRWASMEDGSVVERMTETTLLNCKDKVEAISVNNFEINIKFSLR